VTRNVVMTVGGYGAGGTSGSLRMAWRTAEQLALRGYPTAVVSDADPPAHVEPVPSWPGWRPDVVHAFDLAKPEHVRIGMELADRHGAAFVVTPSSAVGVWPDRALATACLTRADHVFALTPAEAATLEATGTPASRISLLPTPPDLSRTAAATGLRARYGITGPLVLFLGRRVAAKGYPALLDAAPLVWRERPDVTFAVAGPAADGVPMPVVDDRRLLDFGTVDEDLKSRLLVACDVLCLPSRAEVFPLVIVEAWACGRPVVSGDFPGVEDVVRDGVDGLVVPVTADAVARALVRLLADEAARTAMGAAGRDRVRREMSWERVADLVEAGYREVLDRRATPAGPGGGR
jgi:glycosyltransferase involved in cell wall biosynthesis